MRSPTGTPVIQAIEGGATCTLKLKVGLGHDLSAAVAPVLDEYLSGRRLKSMGTASEGSALDVAYEVDLPADDSAEALIKALNQVDGVQSVQIQCRKPKGS